MTTLIRKTRARLAPSGRRRRRRPEMRRRPHLRDLVDTAVKIGSLLYVVVRLAEELWRRGGPPHGLI